VKLDGSLSIRAVAGDGTMVALAKPPPAGTDVWTPVPRRHTTIVVADPSGGNEPETYRLDGNLEPEAFSNDGEGPVRDPVPAADEGPRCTGVASLELEDGDVYPGDRPVQELMGAADARHAPGAGARPRRQAALQRCTRASRRRTRRDTTRRRPAPTARSRSCTS
jgi:hypothetical protein